MTQPFLCLNRLGSLSNCSLWVERSRNPQMLSIERSRNTVITHNFKGDEPLATCDSG